MSDLIDTLKSEHRTIQELLLDAKKAGIASDEGQSKLRKARSLLLAHLRKEDQKLYPALKKLEPEQGLAQSFSEEMEHISKKVMAFFDKYDGADRTFEFATDFGRILGALSNRIRREELSLYPQYDALANPA